LKGEIQNKKSFNKMKKTIKRMRVILEKITYYKIRIEE
jgi:hypothetical protein